MAKSYNETAPSLLPGIGTAAKFIIEKYKSHSMVVQYIRDLEDFGFSGQKYHPKPASELPWQCWLGTCTYNQAQKCLQIASIRLL